MKRKQILLLGGILFILVTIPVALFLVSRNQDTRQRASEGDGTCPAPNATASVTVDFPFCEAGNCDLTKASCEWEAVGDAASYLVTVSQVEDSSVVKNNESVPSTTTKINFPIVQNKTYKCTVVVVSACQSQSTAASDQLLCEADAILETPTPAPPTAAPTATPVPNAPTPIPTAPVVIPPTATPIPTATPVAPTLAPTIGPTSTPVPPIANPGGTVETIGIIGGIMVVIVGGFLMFAL